LAAAGRRERGREHWASSGVQEAESQADHRNRDRPAHQEEFGAAVRRMQWCQQCIGGSEHRFEPVFQPMTATHEAGEIDRTADDGQQSENRERSGHDPRRLMEVRLDIFAPPERPEECHRHEARHVVRGHERGPESEEPGDEVHGIGSTTHKGQREDLILGEEPRQGRHARNGHRGNRHQCKGPRHLAAKPPHVAHVLRVIVTVGMVQPLVHRMNDGTGTEEEQCLEEGVRDQVEDSRRPRA
jgi:hypothetical protein